MINSKKWCCVTLSAVFILTVLLGSLTAVIDPFFHYHAPLEGLSYPISEQRYQNHGILKHFPYNAVITGTSMTENFKTSELDALFGVTSVKVPFSGATFKEIDDNLKHAFRSNGDITLVVRSLDGYMLFSDKDEMRQDAEYPEYLYDGNLLNDVSYWFNVEILLNHTMKVLQYTFAGQPTTSFDDYSSWGERFAFGPEALLKRHSLPASIPDPIPMDEATESMIRENVLQNVISTACENPDVQFYYYFPPYSILWWCNQKNQGNLNRQMDAYRLATEAILQCENIRLFSFVGETEITTDLNHYMDPEHHSAQINSRILRDMHAGRNLLTQENQEAYWNAQERFYDTFDYAGHFAAYGHPAINEAS